MSANAFIGLKSAELTHVGEHLECPKKVIVPLRFSVTYKAFNEKGREMILTAKHGGAFALLLGSGIVWAEVPVNNEDINDPTRQFRNDNHTTSYEERTVDGLTRAECAQYILQNKPDSSVRYQGGIDGHGNPLVPADLYPQPSYGMDEPIDVEMERRRHSHSNNHYHKSRPHKGCKVHHHHHHHGRRLVPYVSQDVTVTPAGDAYFNGDYGGDKERRDKENHCRQTFPGL